MRSESCPDSRAQGHTDADANGNVAESDAQRGTYACTQRYTGADAERSFLSLARLFVGVHGRILR